MAAGWALVAYDVRPDGTETVRLRARGVAPAVATHGAGAPAHAPRAHTDQAAQQAALGAALTYAAQLVERWTSRTVTITVDNSRPR